MFNGFLSITQADSPGDSDREHHRLRLQSFPGHHHLPHLPTGGRPAEGPPRPASLPTRPQLPLLRSQHGVCFESGGVGQSCPGQFGTPDLHRLLTAVSTVGWRTWVLGRLFQIREGMRLNLRAEFTNVFNRTYLNNPTISGTGMKSADERRSAPADRRERRLLPAGIADCLRLRIDQHDHCALPAAGRPDRRAIPVLRESAPQ